MRFLCSQGCEVTGTKTSPPPLYCKPHNLPLIYEKQLARTSKPQKPRKGLKRSEPKRDWSLARAKIEEEGGVCRVCAAFSAEAAHIMGRKFDQPISPGSRTLLVLPDRIVPLCGERFGNGCHARFDRHELDLLPYLTTAEQAQAVLDAGSIMSALKRISPEALAEAAR